MWQCLQSTADKVHTVWGCEPEVPCHDDQVQHHSPGALKFVTRLDTYECEKVIRNSSKGIHGYTGSLAEPPSSAQTPTNQDVEACSVDEALGIVKTDESTPHIYLPGIGRHHVQLRPVPSCVAGYVSKGDRQKAGFSGFAIQPV